VTLDLKPKSRDDLQNPMPAIELTATGKLLAVSSAQMATQDSTIKMPGLKK
jgi:hypothetical protein